MCRARPVPCWRRTEGNSAQSAKASAYNLDAVKAVPDMLFDGAQLQMTLNFGFVPLQYWRGLLRIAYLACFQRFGYVYALSEGGVQVRRALWEGASPERAILSAYPNGDIAVPFSVSLDRAPDGDSHFLVIFPLRSAVLRHFAVLLPTPGGCSLEKLGERATLLRSGLLTVGFNGSDETIKIRFGVEPVAQLREFRMQPKSVGCKE